MKVKRNKSTFCIMPILGIGRDEFYWDFYYLNCYVSVKEYSDDKNKFYLLFNFEGELQAYLTVKEVLNKSDYYEKELLHSSIDNDYVVFVFNIPDKYKEEVKKFKRGEYSKFSRDYKNLIFKIHKVTDKKELYHIIMKTEKRRKRLSLELNHDIDTDTELWEKPRKRDLILILSDLD